MLSPDEGERRFDTELSVRINYALVESLLLPVRVATEYLLQTIYQ